MKKVITILLTIIVGISLTGCGEDSQSTSYPELSYIDNHIEVDQYDMVVETDNDGSRVLFFSADGEKRFKSVYVKETTHLKLINIYDGGEPLINERIND
ncbi:hypothetical protein GCM10012290_22980 [Halolactibacillus alkaliphilus]|uniref:Uncharacterized protein n=1 Tax=Halolactibacillus alkaliphilus TaxID=442899 RepID=A0A511X470_9BACI|nr:hypothetical protein [Halolactibacillus alkaliphilus]GEN57715.1 hypothetical protein HAL01_21790 [Halolactibacillus alkaliphilus]GGN74785.1 hypothetical protein GCM10012290_22980 [Halolactibacillus alkaliphilus]SFP03413.1 hypothetical protein SAMN05720591_1354 [Halolactibacillus alkaliphilus]